MHPVTMGRSVVNWERPRINGDLGRGKIDRGAGRPLYLDTPWVQWNQAPEESTCESGNYGQAGEGHDLVGLSAICPIASHLQVMQGLPGHGTGRGLATRSPRIHVRSRDGYSR